MHSSHSFIALFLSQLLQLVFGVPQVTAPPALLATAIPAVESSSSVAGGPGCGGCIIVADVAGIVWYSGVFVNTAATAVVSVGVGNGTRVTRTSIVQNEQEFTFNPAAGTAAFGTTPLAVTNVGYQSETVINGATLTSPTAYNVFSAYTLTSQQLVGGVCSTTSYESTLPTAYSETLSAGDGQVTLDLAGEQAFISYLGFTRCQGGGENVGGTVLAQVSNLTATTTMFYSSVGLGPMSTTLAPTTNPSASRLPLRTTTLSEVLTTLTATLSGSSTITAIPVSAMAPNIVIGNTTITPSDNPFGLPLTFPTNSTAFPAPTAIGTIGTGVVGGNGTVPFIPGSDAPVWRSNTSVWGSAGLIFLVAIVGWIL
ncbi:MAG: hypothetical protein Q9207_001015 [Kuettlingeria erythrocarpa]